MCLRHDIQLKGFQYGIEEFEKQLNSYVVKLIILKLFPQDDEDDEDNESSLEKITSKLLSQYGVKNFRDTHFSGLGNYYIFGDKTLIPKAVASIYGQSLDRLISEDISLFESVCKKTANQLAPKYFRIMADSFEDENKSA